MPVESIHVTSHGNLQVYVQRAITTPTPPPIDMSGEWSTGSIIAITVITVLFTLIIANFVFLIGVVFKKKLGWRSMCLPFFGMCCWNYGFHLVEKTQALPFADMSKLAVPLYTIDLAEASSDPTTIPKLHGLLTIILFGLFFLKCNRLFLIGLSLKMLVASTLGIGDHDFPHPVGVPYNPRSFVPLDVEMCTMNNLVPVYHRHNDSVQNYFYMSLPSYGSFSSFSTISQGPVVIGIYSNRTFITCPVTGSIQHSVDLSTTIIGLEVSSPGPQTITDDLTKVDFANGINWYPHRSHRPCIYLQTPCSISTHQCLTSVEARQLNSHTREATDGITIIGDSRSDPNFADKYHDYIPTDFDALIAPPNRVQAKSNSGILCSYFGVHEPQSKLTRDIFLNEGVNWCSARDKRISVKRTSCYSYPSEHGNQFNAFYNTTAERRFLVGFYRMLYTMYKEYEQVLMMKGFHWPGLTAKHLDAGKFPDNCYQADPSPDTVTWQAPPGCDCVWTTIWVISGDKVDVTYKDGSTETFDSWKSTVTQLDFAFISPGKCMRSYRHYITGVRKNLWFGMSTYFCARVRASGMVTVFASKHPNVYDCPGAIGQREAALAVGVKFVDYAPGEPYYPGPTIDPTDNLHGSIPVRTFIHDNYNDLFPSTMYSAFYQAHLGCSFKSIDCHESGFLYGEHYVVPGHCDDGEVHGNFTIFTEKPTALTTQVVVATATCNQQQGSNMDGRVCLGHPDFPVHSYNCTISIEDFIVTSSCPFAVIRTVSKLQYVLEGVNVNGYSSFDFLYEDRTIHYNLVKTHALYVGNVDMSEYSWSQWVDLVASFIVLATFLFWGIKFHKWTIWIAYWFKNLFFWRPPAHPVGPCPICGADVKNTWFTHYTYLHAGWIDLFTFGFWRFRSNLPPLNTRKVPAGSVWIRTRSGAHYQYSVVTLIFLWIFCMKPTTVTAAPTGDSNVDYALLFFYTIYAFSFIMFGFIALCILRLLTRMNRLTLLMIAFFGLPAMTQAIALDSLSVGQTYTGNFPSFTVLKMDTALKCSVKGYGCKNPIYDFGGGLKCSGSISLSDCCDGFDPSHTSGHSGQPWCVKVPCMGGWTTGCFYIGVNCLYQCAWSICNFGDLVPYLECEGYTRTIIAVGGSQCDLATSGSGKCGDLKYTYTPGPSKPYSGYNLDGELYHTVQSPNYYFGNVSGESMDPPVCSYYIRNNAEVTVTCTGAQSISYDQSFGKFTGGVLDVTGGSAVIDPEVSRTSTCTNVKPTIITCWRNYDDFSIQFMFRDCNCSTFKDVTYPCGITLVTSNGDCCIDEGDCAPATNGPNWQQKDLGYHIANPMSGTSISALDWFKSMANVWYFWIILAAIIIGLIVLVMVVWCCCSGRYHGNM